MSCPFVSSQSKASLNFTEKLGALNYFPLTVNCTLLSSQRCFCKESISVHSQPLPSLPPWITSCREFAALIPGQLTQVCCTPLREHQAGNPTKKCSHKYILAIETHHCKVLLFFSFFFFQFYILDSLRFGSQNTFYPNKGCYYYYSPVITQH